MTDREITEWKVNLKDTRLILEQKVKVYNLIEEHHDACSLWDERETHPQVEVHFKVA